MFLPLTFITLKIISRASTKMLVFVFYEVSVMFKYLTTARYKIGQCVC